MAREGIVVILYTQKENQKIDVDFALKITANEAIIGLNEGFQLGMDTRDLSRCCLKTENPTALLRGNRTLEEYGLRDGTVIHFV